MLGLAEIFLDEDGVFANVLPANRLLKAVTTVTVYYARCSPRITIDGRSAYAVKCFCWVWWRLLQASMEKRDAFYSQQSSYFFQCLSPDC